MLPLQAQWAGGEELVKLIVSESLDASELTWGIWAWHFSDTFTYMLQYTFLGS